MRKENPEEHGDKYAELERADFSLKSIVTRTLARPLIMLAVEPIMMTVTVYLSVGARSFGLASLSRPADSLFAQSRSSTGYCSSFLLA